MKVRDARPKEREREREASQMRFQSSMIRRPTAFGDNVCVRASCPYYTFKLGDELEYIEYVAVLMLVIIQLSQRKPRRAVRCVCCCLPF